MLEFLIIADDLSGACDTAVQFRKFGYRTLVLNRTDRAHALFDRYDVIALATNTRDLTPDGARKSILKLCPFFSDIKGATFYKKIDSTWRGNIGSELEVLLKQLQLGFALICSAFPENMRIGLGGYLLVDGQLLHRMPMAKDTASPIAEGYLPTLLSRQTDLPVEYLPLRLIERGDDAIERFIAEKVRKGPCLFIADATEQSHLDTIAEISSASLPPFIFAGSAGLASAICRRSRRMIRKSSFSVLTVVGSIHPKNNVQIEKLIRTYRIQERYIPLEVLIHAEPKQPLRAFSAEAAGILAKGEDLVIRTYPHNVNIESSVSKDSLRGRTRTDLADTIAGGLQRFVMDILEKTAVGGIMVTGGATALKLLEGLQGEGIEVHREIEPGVPFGRIVGGDFNGMKIITKAGGFGSPEVFCTGLEVMKQTP